MGNQAHFANGKFICGKVGTYFYTLCFGSRPRNWTWRWTVMQGVKKGLPQMSTLGVTRAALSHQERLTRKKTSDPLILESVRKMSQEALGKITMDDWLSYEPHSWFSDRACLDFGFGLGPNWDLIRRHYLSLDDQLGERPDLFDKITTPRKSLIDFVRSELGPGIDRPSCFKEKDYTCLGKGKGPIWSKAFLIGSAQQDLYRMKEVNLPRPFGRAIGSFYLPEWAFWVPSICQETIDAIRDDLIVEGACRVKFILEPLKVRPITAGDTDTNGIFQSLQKEMWRRLQDHWQFSLTGESLGVGNLKQLSSRSWRFWDGLIRKEEFRAWKFASGDFSAATDQLHGDLTRACIDAIAGDSLTKKVLRNGLTDNRIFYNRDPLIDRVDFGDQGGEDDVIMSNGQLMGCVFSFIFLCIINAAIFRYTLEQNVEFEVPLEELPVLINGDDIAFFASDDFHRDWCNDCLRSGLEPSLGKNFLSSEFCTMNSKLYVMDDTILETFGGSENGMVVDFWVPGFMSFELVPYMNMSFMTGISKGDSSEMSLTRSEAERDLRIERRTNPHDFPETFWGSYRFITSDAFDFKRIKDQEDLKDYLAVFQKRLPQHHDLVRIPYNTKDGTRKELKVGPSLMAVQSGVESVREMWFSGERYPRSIPLGSWLHAQRCFESYRKVILEYRHFEIRDSGLSRSSGPNGLGLIDQEDDVLRLARSRRLTSEPRGGLAPVGKEWEKLAAPYKVYKKEDVFVPLKTILVTYTRAICSKKVKSEKSQFLRGRLEVQSKIKESFVTKRQPIHRKSERTLEVQCLVEDLTDNRYSWRRFPGVSSVSTQRGWNMFPVVHWILDEDLSRVE